MSNGGRGTREAFLAKIEQESPKLYADLLAMRTRDPQGFRKRIRTLSTREGTPIKMLVKLDVEDGYPGRSRDPDLEARLGDLETRAAQMALPDGAHRLKTAANAEVTSGASDEAVRAKKPSKGKGAKGEEVSKDNVNVKAEDTTAQTVAPIGLAVPEAAREEPKKAARKKKA
jgi:hypothetical protein